MTDTNMHFNQKSKTKSKSAAKINTNTRNVDIPFKQPFPDEVVGYYNNNV